MLYAYYYINKYVSSLWIIIIFVNVLGYLKFEFIKE